MLNNLTFDLENSRIRDDLNSYNSYVSFLKSKTKGNYDFENAWKDLFINQIQYATWLLYKLGVISLAQYTLIELPEAIWREADHFVVDFVPVKGVRFHYRADLLYTMVNIYKSIHFLTF